MNAPPKKITLREWDRRHTELLQAGHAEPWYGGPLSRHLDDDDLRLRSLLFDNSAAALRLWNLLLTEETRLARARERGRLIVGAMKDLGTVPVMAFAAPELVAFYPDGAWWTPCLMENRDGLMRVADALGFDETFCPVRAMLGAFALCDRFPIPDLLVCSAGAVCDDFSSVAQRVESLGHKVLWWEIPARRSPEPDEPVVTLPGGFESPAEQVGFVRRELERVREALGRLAGRELTDRLLEDGIRAANGVRRRLAELRRLVYTAPRCPLPALEMLVAEMLAIHFCSDREETEAVYDGLLEEVRARIAEETGTAPPGAVRVFWVNPVADLRAMNVLEDCGGRLCGTEFLFCHAIDEIPEDLPPMEALARMALADPMVGPARDRARRICEDAVLFGAEAVVISRLPFLMPSALPTITTMVSCSLLMAPLKSLRSFSYCIGRSSSTR